MALQSYLTNFGGFNNGNAIAGGSQGVIVPEQWALEGNGVPPSFFQSTVTVAATDNILSTYLIAKNLPANAMLASLLVEADSAIATATWDIGLYNSLTGAVIVKDCFAAAQNWTAGSTKVAPFDGLAALTHEQTKQALWQVLGLVLNTAAGCYDLVLQAHVAPTGAGSITFRGLWTPPG